MSLNMYLGETDTQTKSMNAICIEMIQSMEQAMNSIDSFTGAMLLQGETYKTAKMYMSATFRPLAQGIIYLCEELIRENDKYPSDFRSEVATTDVIEQEIVEQIQEIDRQKARMEELNEKISLLGPLIFIYDNMKRKLQEKLNRLHEFNTTSSSNYNTAFELASSVAHGLAQVQGGKGFNSKTGIFSTKGMDLDWIAKLDDTHYTRIAKEKYGGYLKKNQKDKDKVIAIIKYEEKHPEYVEQTDDFLTPLEERDIVEIKYLMYTADEPYRMFALQYLDDLVIDSLEGKTSFFSSDNNSLTYIVAKDRLNDQGAYFTFFHELGHAIDYNYGKEIGENGFISDVFTSHTGNGNTLAEQMYVDVENRIRLELKYELNKSVYNDIGMEAKTKMINNITEVYIYKGPLNDELTSAEENLYELITNQLKSELYSDEHNNASDVYGGVTINQIKGKWAHHENGYWIDEDTGERVREPNREGFASYYGSIMIKNGELRDKELASLDEYLLNSRKHMDEIFKSMNEGGVE